MEDPIPSDEFEYMVPLTKSSEPSQVKIAPPLYPKLFEIVNESAVKVPRFEIPPPLPVAILPEIIVLLIST